MTSVGTKKTKTTINVFSTLYFNYVKLFKNNVDRFGKFH
jgi:hypothetical protein